MITRTLQKKKEKIKKRKKTVFLVDFLYSLDSVRSLEMQHIPASFTLYALIGFMQFPWLHAVLSILDNLFTSPPPSSTFLHVATISYNNCKYSYLIKDNSFLSTPYKVYLGKHRRCQSIPWEKGTRCLLK